MPKSGVGDIEELMACMRIEEHASIMKFVGILDYDSKLCLVTEHYKWGDLEDCHGKFGLHAMPRLAKLLLDVASGTLHLHSQKPSIIHRDIRCANILLHAGHWSCV